MKVLKSRVLVIGTGGTMACVQTKKGLEPAHTSEDFLTLFPDIASRNAEVQSISLLNLDSSNIGPKEWKLLAKTIYEKYNEYDGFIIIHGTDTMAFTTAALSYSLQNLAKPVVFTGCVWPLDHPQGAMAKKNLSDALVVATTPSMRGVSVCYDDALILGTHAKKISNEAVEFDHFDEAPEIYASVGLPTMGIVHKGKLIENKEYMQKRNLPKPIPVELVPNFETNVGCVKVYPGMPDDIWECLGKRKGLIIEGFSVGHIPASYGKGIEKITEMNKKGIPVFVTSQNTYGFTDLNMYEVGNHLKKAGAVSLKNMGTQSALIKLMWILGNFSPKREDVEKLMLHNYCGEIFEKLKK